MATIQRTPREVAQYVLESARIKSEFLTVPQIVDSLFDTFALCRVNVTTPADRAAQRPALKPSRVIEQLPYSIDHFDEGGNLIEVLGRVSSIVAARAAYDACIAEAPDKLIVLRQGGGRVLRSSDRVD